MANRITNAIGGRAGKGVPHLFNSKLYQYGFSKEEQIAYRRKGFKWCGWHKQFEQPSGFDKGCKICRSGARLRDLELYKKDGNALKYRVPRGWYAAKLEQQGLHCALCPATVCSKKYIRLCIDHSHICCPGHKRKSCGKCVRGLLCLRCNHRLGQFEMFLAEGEYIAHSGTWAERALAYLKSYDVINLDNPVTSL